MRISDWVQTCALPISGLNLASNGTLSGTPTASGTFNVTVTATDANSQTAEHAYTLTIAIATLSVTPAAVPAGTVGVDYTQDISPGGGVAPYTSAQIGTASRRACVCQSV